MSRTTILLSLLCIAVSNLVAAEETLRAPSVGTPPALDGVVDPVWEQAPELSVSVSPVARDVGERYEEFDPRRRTSGREVRLRALVSGGRLFLLANWPDPTHSVVKKPWVWNAEKDSYAKGPGDEDRFSLLLPMGKEITSCMVEGVSFVGDLWHWKAARTEPAGYADDQSLRMGIKNFRGAEEWFGPGGRTVYGKRFNDSGTSAYEERKEPPSEFTGQTVARYLPRTPEGSRADVRSGAKWSDGSWTLELSRDLDTGDERGDLTLAHGDVIAASVAVFDDCGDLYHATSPVFNLILE